MGSSEKSAGYVLAPQDIAWHKTELGPKFWLSDELVDENYSTLFSAQLTKFGPGGGSSPHSHDYNHAFYFLNGSCAVQIEDATWQVETGSFVRVPAHKQHSVVNNGTEDLVFLVIYDPPNVDDRH